MQPAHRIIFAVIINIVFLLSFTRMVHADDVERIITYQSYITIHKDRTLTVTETIKVICANQQIQHGIFRTFPTRYKDRFLNTVRIKFQIIEVMKNGLPEPYHTEKVSNGIKLYIGSKDVFLRPGEYTYTIVYQTDRQIGFFEDFDELYWNVTGNEWEFAIEQAEAVIELPPEATVLNKIAYTGRQGSQGRDYTIGHDAKGNVKFTTTYPLMSGEGLTVAVSWQKGVIPEPSTEQKMGDLFSDNQNALAALLGLIILFIYYFVVWSKVGKDPEKGVIYPQFAPPPGFTPSATRYVMRMGYSDRVFAAAIVNMAVKGYLRIAEEKGEFTLSRKSGDDSILSSGEKKIARKLFGSRYSIVLKQKNHRTIGAAISELKKSLKRDFEKLHFLRNSNYLVPGILITILTFVAVIFTSSERAGAAMMTLWLSGWTAGTGFLVYNAIKAWKNAFTDPGSGISKKAGALGGTLFTLPFVGGELFGLYAFTAMTSLLTVLLILIFILLNIIFYRLLKAPTILGRRMMDQIEGFKMYLETAEEDRLNMLNSPHKTPELFEKFLPYALALDVENAWAEKFANILASSSQDTSYSPAWYSGRNWRSMGTSGFASGLGSSLSSAISSSSTAPGSRSGSGGGGSSGGGGGGGGGGGW